MSDRLRQMLYHHATRLLTRPLRGYSRCSDENVDRLKRHVSKGDVVLVYGDQRVSEVIRYLTQSSWSHAAIYVGDEWLRREPEIAAQLEERFGEDAQHCVVEALVGEGVVVSPISKYRGFHLRLCRPFGLEPEDLRTVMDKVLRHVGGDYDVAHLIDLARYFLPVSLVPWWWRREALELGSGRPTEVICSSMIAQAFDAVGFPILPRTEDEEAELLAAGDELGGGRRTARDGTFGSTGEPRPRRVYHAGAGAPSWPSRRPLAHHLRSSRRRRHDLVTPRDFDLSPYFEVIKFNLIEDARRPVLRASRATTNGFELRRAARRSAQVVTPLWQRLSGWTRRAAGDAPPPTHRASGGSARG